MHPAVSLFAEKTLNNQHLLVPILFVALSTVANLYGPAQHSLLVTAASWALVWIPAVFRAGLWSSSSKNRRTTCWLAGGFLGLAAICERAANDKEGIWATRGLLPLLVVVLAEHDVLATHLGLPSYEPPVDDAASDSSSIVSEAKPRSGSWRILAVVTASALAALATRSGTAPPTTALGLSSVIFTAAGLVLFESSLRSSTDDGDARRGLMSANGTVLRRNSVPGTHKDHQLSSLRDVALVMTAVCSMAAYLCEPAITPRAITWQSSYRQLHGDWTTLHYHRLIQQCLLMVFVNVLVNTLLFFMLSQHGVVHTTFFSLFSYMCARFNNGPSFSSIWFAIIFGSTSLFFLHSSSSSVTRSEVRGSLRFRRIVFGVTAVSVGLLLLRFMSGYRYDTPTTNDTLALQAHTSETPLGPISMNLGKGHPAEQLIRAAEKDFKSLLGRQSKSLAEAVEEYKRRNGIPPPPHFDKWYEFAKRNGIKLIDEFDSITDTLLPFWALKPSTIRERLRLALGNDENALIGVMVRDGNVVKIEHGQDWEQQATTGMMKEFVQYLPDMDLAFNIHDEPRVVVPHDQLSSLLQKAKEVDLAAAMRNQSPRNAFSARPSDMNDGTRFDVETTSRFNKFAHQQTWTHARLSCPVDSPARNFEDNPPDNLTSYAAAPLNYVYNQTAFSNICNAPSLATHFGFFERPNAFNIIHELTPIFSQSKISSFQDILYPSRWYWFGKVGYDESRDTTWENKTNSLYWRGSTTGGFSRGGGWRRQHRQHIVKRLNAHDKAQLLVDKTDEGVHSYEVVDVERRDFEKYVDVKFSHVGQCDPGDCDAQKEFFDVVERVDGQDAWYYKHLLDMDGNAFSGRFYAFLKSRSLVYKMAMFREWHQEWLKPWVHYVPISLMGDEHLDLVRWFGGGGSQPEGLEGVDDGKGEGEQENKGGNGDSVGEKRARQIAERSSEWAGQVLRNVDFEAWFFRLLLEYGRIIDDDRAEIGYPGP